MKEALTDVLASLTSVVLITVGLGGITGAFGAVTYVTFKMIVDFLL